MANLNEINHISIAIDYWKHFLIFGLKTFYYIILASIVSIVLIYVYYPWAKYFLLLTILSTGLHISAIYVSAVRGSDKKQDVYGENDFMNTLIMTVMMSVYFTPLLFVSPLLSSYIDGVYGMSVIGLLLSLYYPVIDFQIIRKYRISPGGIPAVIIFKGLSKMGFVSNVDLLEIIGKFIPEKDQEMSANDNNIGHV